LQSGWDQSWVAGCRTEAELDLGSRTARSRRPFVCPAFDSMTQATFDGVIQANCANHLSDPKVIRTHLKIV
jgi:hypothetical protein